MTTDNPYDRGILINYKEGDQSLQREKIVYVPSVDDRFHVVREDDQLEAISFLYYKTTKYWWLIADCNNLFDPFVLTTGTKLVIPDRKTLTKSSS